MIYKQGFRIFATPLRKQKWIFECYEPLQTSKSKQVFFLPQKFRGIPAKFLQKSFVISMGLPPFLRVEIIQEKINTGMINSNKYAILFGALEFVQTIISQLILIS